MAKPSMQTREIYHVCFECHTTTNVFEWEDHGTKKRQYLCPDCAAKYGDLEPLRWGQPKQ